MMINPMFPMSPFILTNFYADSPGVSDQSLIKIPKQRHLNNSYTLYSFNNSYNK